MTAPAPELFNPMGRYRYAGGFNIAGLLAWIIAGGFAAWCRNMPS